MSSLVLRRLLFVGLLSFGAVLLSSESANAQARSWHYNSNNYTQPGSMPWYSGAPNRRLPFWRKPASTTTILGAPAVGAPAYTQPVGVPATGCGMPAPTANYAAPSACGVACNSGGMTRTVGYVPQTTYRTVYRPVPVTQYQPVASCGPCGQSVTAYRPVTTYVNQPQRVAMTSYLAVPTVAYRPPSCTVGCTTAYAASPCATSACSTGACGTTTAGYYSSSSSSCSTCTTGSTLTPSAGGLTPTGANTSLEPTPALKPGEGTELRESGDSGTTFKTDKPISSTEIKLESPLNGNIEIEMGRQVEPSAVKKNLYSTPRFLTPEDQRTDHRRPTQIRTAVFSQPRELTQAEQDAQGWKSVSGK